MTHTNGRRRVVVTGQGVVTPLGTGVESFWAALKKGECGIRQAQSFSTEDLYITIAGEVPDFDPKERLKASRSACRQILAICRLRGAGSRRQSKLELPLKDSESYRSACIIGSGVGGLTTLEFSYKMLFKENKRATHPLTLLKAIGSSASAHVSIEYGIKGPTFGVVSACATATHSIGLTYRMIREGPGRFWPRRRRRSLAQLGRDPGLAGDARAEPRRIVSLLQAAERHRARRGRRHPDARGIRARQGARRPDPGRADGLWHDRRRRRHGQPLDRRGIHGHADGPRRRRPVGRPISTM